MTHPVIIVNSHLAAVHCTSMSIFIAGTCPVLTLVLCVKQVPLLPVCIRFKPTAATFLHFVECLVSVSPLWESVLQLLLCVLA